MDTLSQLFIFMLHIDQQLGVLSAEYGVYIYVILFLIVFGETGFVVLPFLPGDSLLFIAGALAAKGGVDPWLLSILLIVAAVAGNTVNYWAGKFFGGKMLERDSRWISKEALIKTHYFYEKHGGKALVIARFVPLVRTFAPFVAGISNMNMVKFQRYNVLGAVLWVVSLVWGGYFFGQAEFTVFGKHIVVEKYLSTIAMIGFLAALIPAILGFVWNFFRSRSKE